MHGTKRAGLLVRRAATLSFLLNRAIRAYFGACLATILVIGISSQARTESLEEVLSQRTLAQDWLDGKVQPDDPPKVTYSGLPFTMRVTSHQAANSPAIVGILAPSLRLPETYPLMGVMSMPGVYASTEIATVVSEELYDKYFRHDVEKQGVVMGRLKAGSGTNLYSIKPIRTVADIAGLKVGVASETGRRNLLALGATPVVMTSTQVAKAFASGELDAVLYPDAPAGVYGIAKTAKYRTELNTGGHYNAEYCLSKKLWDAFPRDLQIVFNAWARAQAQAETQILYSVGDARALEGFRASGLETIIFDAEQRSLRARKTSGVVDEWIAAQEAAGRPARQLIEDVKAVVRRYQDVTPNDLMRRAINQPLVLNAIKAE